MRFWKSVSHQLFLSSLIPYIKWYNDEKDQQQIYPKADGFTIALHKLALNIFFSPCFHRKSMFNTMCKNQTTLIHMHCMWLFFVAKHYKSSICRQLTFVITCGCGIFHLNICQLSKMKVLLSWNELKWAGNVFRNAGMGSIFPLSYIDCWLVMDA